MWKQLDHDIDHGGEVQFVVLTFTRPAPDQLPAIPDGMTLGDVLAETERIRSRILAAVAEDLTRLAELDALAVQIVGRRAT
jgi:hypothetical protein